MNHDYLRVVKDSMFLPLILILSQIAINLYLAG